MQIQVYSDGSAQTADKPGGWGSVVLIDGVLHKELSGHLEFATNNDAELIAATRGLDYTLKYIADLSTHPLLDIDITLISDSQIVLNWANGTYRFKQIDKMPLYNELRALVKNLKVKTQWVKGHSGNPWNERCDKLANNARKLISTETLDKEAPKADTRIGTKKSGVVAIWYKDGMILIDLDNMIMEPYNKELHGKRGSFLEIREEKERKR